MSQALCEVRVEGKTNRDRRPPSCLEVCEETGARLFRAGDYVAPGEYVEIETRRRIHLATPDFLPARLDGQVACYRLAQPGWGESRETALGQRQAQFQTLVAQTHTRLFNFVRRTVGNAHDAEDVTQEALTRAWLHFEDFDAQRSFEAWVFRIAGNLLIDHSRRKHRRQEISLDMPTACVEGEEGACHPELAARTGDPQECLLAKEIDAELQGALRCLPPLHQATLLLVAQEHTYEQIARAFACPVGTVRSRVYRARVLLRRNLKESTFLKERTLHD